MARLFDIEIFRTGAFEAKTGKRDTYDGDWYSKDDLDEMVANFGRVGFQVPLKLGRGEESGSPAYGWVENIRREGSVLKADIGHIPDKLFNLIKRRQFKSLGSEIFWNLKRGGQTFRRVLKSVFFEGIDPAAIGFRPVRDMINENSMLAEFRQYTIDERLVDMSDQYSDRPDLAVDRIIRAYAVEHNVSYEQAFNAVQADPANAAAFKAYENMRPSPCASRAERI